MAVYKVDATSGNDSNPGTVALPKLTWAGLISAVTLAAGDIVIGTGHFREAVAWVTVANVIFTDSTGEAECIIDGGTIIPSGTWSATANTHFVAHEDSTASVTKDYSTSVGDGTTLPVIGRFGHLKPAADLATCEATDDSFFHDTGAGELHVRVGANDNPAAFVMEWCIGTTSGFAFSSSESVIVERYTLRRWCDNTSGYGYGIYFVGSNNHARNCTIIDHGFHGIGVAGSGVHSGNTISGCTFAGLSASGGSMVFFGDNGSTGNRAYDCTVHLYRHALSISASVAVSTNLNACFSHTPTLGRIHNMEWRNITVRFWLGNTGTAFNGDSVPTPGNVNVPSTYGLRFVDCTLLNNRALNLTTHGAFIRCSLRFGEGGAGTIADGHVFMNQPNHDNGLPTDDDDHDIDKQWIFEGCEIICDFDGAGTTFFGNTTNTASAFRFINSTMFDVGTAANQGGWFNLDSNDQFIYARGCIFGWQSTARGLRRLIINDSAFDNASTQRNFSGNYYVRFTTYSANADWNTEAEWLNTSTGIDVTGVASTTVPLNGLTAGLADAGNASVSAAFAALRNFRTTPHTHVGFNNRPFGGNYGAWQYGPPGGRTIRTMRTIRTIR